MGNILRRRRDRRVESLQLELEVVLETPTTPFRFSEHDERLVTQTLAEATECGAYFVNFPDGSQPKSVFNKKSSRAEMRGKIET